MKKIEFSEKEILEFRNIMLGLLGNYTLSKVIRNFEDAGERPIVVY
jgi:hypothetical protein